MVLLKQAKHQNWKVNKGERLPAYPQWRQGRLRLVASGCFLLQVRGPLTERAGSTMEQWILH